VSGVQFASNYSLEDGMRNNVGIIHTHENLLKMDNVMKICTGGSDMVGNIVGELATVSISNFFQSIALKIIFSLLNIL